MSGNENDLTCRDHIHTAVQMVHFTNKHFGWLICSPIEKAETIANELIEGGNVTTLLGFEQTIWMN